jgi:hypothetical protein
MLETAPPASRTEKGGITAPSTYLENLETAPHNCSIYLEEMLRSCLEDKKGCELLYPHGGDAGGLLLLPRGQERLDNCSLHMEVLEYCSSCRGLIKDG